MNAVLRPEPPPWHRPMQAVDLDAVLAIEAMAYPYPWTRGNFIDSLAAGYTAELRLDSAGQLVGYWVALPGFEETHLLNLSVAPMCQRAGHGLAMLRRLQAAARQRGDLAIWLEVRQSNVPARALYQRFGFVEVGCRRDYYPAGRHQREDTLVMRLPLDTPTTLAIRPSQGRDDGAADALV